MAEEKDFTVLRVSEEKLEKIKAAVKEFEEDPNLSVDELAAKYEIPRRSLYYYFKKLGIITPRTAERIGVAKREVRKAEIDALSTEAEKIATIAIGIGGVIARRYLPLIDHLLSKRRTLEMIAEDVMDWYEMKIPTETRIKELETQIQSLNEQFSEAYVIAMPNFKYMLRANLVLKYAKHLLVARMNGLRVPLHSTLKALHNDLVTLDQDVEEAIIRE